MQHHTLSFNSSLSICQPGRSEYHSRRLNRGTTVASQCSACTFYPLNHKHPRSTTNPIYGTPPTTTGRLYNWLIEQNNPSDPEDPASASDCGASRVGVDVIGTRRSAACSSFSKHQTVSAATASLIRHCSNILNRGQSKAEIRESWAEKVVVLIHGCRIPDLHPATRRTVCLKK